jgi:hypothetical protein
MKLGRERYDVFLRYWNEERHMRQYFDLISDLKENRTVKGMAV